MRLTQPSWLIALCAVLSVALCAIGCSKDDATSSEATAASDESAVDDESDDEADEDEADEGEAVDKAAPPEKPAPSKKSKRSDKADTAVAKAAPAARGDKARDRVAAAKRSPDAAASDTGTKTEAAPDKGTKAEAASDKGTKAEAASDKGNKAEAASDKRNKAEGAASDTLLSPAERRKAERERRIMELKRRNEERRKERMDKVDEQRRESEALAKEARPPVAEAKAKPKAMSLTKYITQAEVRTLLGNDTLVADGGLAGIDPSERYNSVYFAPPVRTSFGLSVQVWKDKTRRDANVRFRRMRAQYANAEDTTSPTAKSFFSQWDDILTLSFADLTKRVVVSVSCSAKLCKPAKILAVAKSISGKL